jgi:hypothetical protein
MRLARTLAAAVVAMAFASPSATWASSPPGKGSLHGVQTLVAAAESVRTVVTLPRPVRLPGKADCLLSDRARFSGSARQAAVFLTTMPLTPDSQIIMIAGFTLGGRAGRYDTECLSTKIPAGQYLLQYVHTPGTSRVRLTLPGLSGRGTLTVRGTDESVIAELPTVLSGPADPATHAWGTRRTLASRGSVMTLGLIEAGSSDGGYDAQGTCLTEPHMAAVPDAVQYAPGCPLGGTGASNGFTGLYTWEMTIKSNIPAASYGAGYWFLGTPTHQPRGAVSVWLTNLSG